MNAATAMLFAVTATAPPPPSSPPCDTVLPNQQPGLLPPVDPGGWRGSTAGWGMTDASLNLDPHYFKEKYGFPLQIMRIFQGANYAGLTDLEKSWVAEGGIIWYGVTEEDWAGMASGAKDRRHPMPMLRTRRALVGVLAGWRGGTPPRARRPRGHVLTH